MVKIFYVIMIKQDLDFCQVLYYLILTLVNRERQPQRHRM